MTSATTRYYEACVPLWEPCEGGTTYFIAASDMNEAKRILKRATILHDRAEWKERPASDVVTVDRNEDAGHGQRPLSALHVGECLPFTW
jgi:hypothetical protein